MHAVSRAPPRRLQTPKRTSVYSACLLAPIYEIMLCWGAGSTAIQSPELEKRDNFANGGCWRCV